MELLLSLALRAEHTHTKCSILSVFGLISKISVGNNKARVLLVIEALEYCDPPQSHACDAVPEHKYI